MSNADSSGRKVAGNLFLPIQAMKTPTNLVAQLVERGHPFGWRGHRISRRGNHSVQRWHHSGKCQQIGDAKITSCRRRQHRFPSWLSCEVGRLIGLQEADEHFTDDAASQRS